ncbi:helix-turn-helix domain-containing protein [Undibacterium seohonense]|uniref:Helix-turn-helix domain-containing protein n=1 Tax=Undibacterium seohonense TaxID=1344950 RepID=A0ABR6X3C3_9BURK|nr:helix-turn-helix transcriptional regulator [Undibacterium seohonense]MBC3807055.1 helix-turn-helix domain-containing protein [Undibacterium seohonense]
MKQVISVPDQLGHILQSSRKSARISQALMADKLGISQSRISAMELDPASISLGQLLTMMAALDLELIVQSKPSVTQISDQTAEW